MKEAASHHPWNPALDEYTNRVLSEYPVHCISRMTPLGQRLQLHAHNGYELYLCVQGSGSYIVGDRLYPLQSGTLTVIRPHAIHRPYSGGNQEFHRYILTLDELYLAKLEEVSITGPMDLRQLLVADGQESSHYFLGMHQLHQWVSLFSRMERALAERPALFGMTILQSTAELILLLAERSQDTSMQEAAKTEDEQLAGNILSYLIAHHHEEVSIEDLVQRYPVSRSRLFQLFKESTGYSVMQFLVQYRLNRARKLLLDTNLPITDVAVQVGFNDISHFFHTFKKDTGCTPKAYRTMVLGRGREEE